MTLTVEIGTGDANADAYESVLGVHTYNSSHAQDAAWIAASTGDKEQAIRIATQYLDSSYVLAWQGTRSNEFQNLDWPRANVVLGGWATSPDNMPRLLQDACAELGIKANSATDKALFDDEGSPGSILEEEVQVDTIKERIKYAGGKSQQTLYTLSYRMVIALLNTGTAVRA